MSKLTGKVAIVTGASKGIGAALAKGLAAAGAAVGVNYFSGKKGAERPVSEITSKGGKAIAIQADVSKAADVSGGSIINISSIASENPVPNSSLYSATKGAIDTITMALAKELGPRKIRGMIRRAAVIGLIVASPLAAIAGYNRLSPSVELHAQARAVPAPAALPDFSAVVAAYSSAVVNIAAAETVRASDPASGRDVIALAGGSGFVVSPDGVILTSAHLVDRADTIVVTLTDRRQFNARVLGQDRESDVAVVKIDAEELPTVTLGQSSSVRPGEWVIAIGSPFGFESTVTSGIVSAKSRFLPNQPYVPFIQTDVPVNPGNSGGPLFNVNGEVVGINVAMYSASGGSVGLSFAVPIDVAVKVKDRLLRDGRIRRGSLGVSTQDLTQQFADFVGLGKRQGALVIAVEEDGPAARAGLQPGDVILSMDGILISEANELPRRVADVEPGSLARLHIWRHGREEDITAVLGELREPPVAPPHNGGEASTSPPPVPGSSEPPSEGGRKVLEGSVVMQVKGGEEVTLTPGQTFYLTRFVPSGVITSMHRTRV